MTGPRATLSQLHAVREAFPATEPGLDVLSELGAAERLARLHGHELRYDHRRGRWLTWAGHRWTLDMDGSVVRLGHAFCRRWQRDALDLPDRDLRAKTSAFAFKLERDQQLANVLRIAQALKPIADAGESWDADPWLLGCLNGVLAGR